MTKRKLQRFADNENFENLFQYTYQRLQCEGFPMKGQWSSNYFKNDHPLVLELGCGKGEYTVNLARQEPEKNFIGIDLKGARIWRGCKTARDEKMKNVAFIRSRVDFIEEFFAPGEVDEIWITFPDPQPQSPREKKRLSAPVFLNRYHNILAPGGAVHLKTDNESFFRYTLETLSKFGHEVLYATRDLYNSDAPGILKSIRTFYENIYLAEGKKIGYLKFRLHGKSE